MSNGYTPQIPEHCSVQGCLLDGIDLERYHIAPTRNCPGPASRDGANITEFVQVYSGGVAEMVEQTRTIKFARDDGTLRTIELILDVTKPHDRICRNVGILASLNAMLEESGVK